MAHELHETTPEPTGMDTSFLVDGGNGYFNIMTIDDMINAIESDAYYDEPGRLDNALVYKLEPGKAPVRAVVEYELRGSSEEFVYKLMKIIVRGELTAQHGFKIPA